MFHWEAWPTAEQWPRRAAHRPRIPGYTAPRSAALEMNGLARETILSRRRTRPGTRPEKPEGRLGHRGAREPRGTIASQVRAARRARQIPTTRRARFPAAWPRAARPS